VVPRLLAQLCAIVVTGLGGRATSEDFLPTLTPAEVAERNRDRQREAKLALMRDIMAA